MSAAVLPILFHHQMKDRKMNEHVRIDDLSTSASTSDRLEAATLRLKCIIGSLRQIGAGNNSWTGIDVYLPDALSIMGNDLQVIHDLVDEIIPTTYPKKQEVGALEAMHRDYQGRARLYDTMPSAAPGDTEADRVDWLSAPADNAQTASPQTARDWAAKVLLMTLDGSTLERERHLQALIDDARATLGIAAVGKTS